MTQITKTSQLQQHHALSLTGVAWRTAILFSFYAVLCSGQPIMAAKSTHFDVVVVGAGVSGLTAANTLHRQLNQSVVVLEARDRIGGRTWSRNLDSANGQQRWDVGGQWVGNTQKHVNELLTELKLETYPQYAKGLNILVNEHGNVQQYEGDEIPGGGIIGGLDALQLFARNELNGVSERASNFRTFQSDAKKISPLHPFEDSKANKWNKITLAEWSRQNGWTQEGRNAIDLVIGGPMDVDSSNVSALFSMMYLNSAGSNIEVFTEDKGNGAQAFKIKNGAQSIAESLFFDLPPDTVRLNTPVVSIHDSGSQVQVTTKSGETFTAKKVVVATPPCLAAKINFTPPLEDKKKILLSGLQPKGNAWKFIATYPEPFWRQAGLSGSGMIMFNAGGTRPEIMFQSSMLIQDASTSENGWALVGFAEFPSGSTPPDTAGRRAAYIEQLVRAFRGDQRYAKTIDFVDQNWSLEEFSLGAVAAAGVGLLTPDYPQLIRAPTGNVHWAGTETATIWMGYISGAVQAGKRAAMETVGQTYEPDQIATNENDASSSSGSSSSRGLFSRVVTLVSGWFPAFL